MSKLCGGLLTIYSASKTEFVDKDNESLQIIIQEMEVHSRNMDNFHLRNEVKKYMKKLSEHL